MAIDKQEFLVFAKGLPVDSEINNRNAISRSYYTAYHSCLEVYKPNLTTIHGGVHSQLIESLEKSTDQNDRKIGFILKDIRNRRSIADYFLNDEVTESDRDKAIKSTERLVGLINGQQSNQP
jgi:uncharacterized protein (UPF0332 family)